jgi:general stress protein YciG
MADNSNASNFSNRPREEVQSIGKKGGQSGLSGGFASMDPSKQVCSYPYFPMFP